MSNNLEPREVRLDNFKSKHLDASRLTKFTLVDLEVIRTHTESSKHHTYTTELIVDMVPEVLGTKTLKYGSGRVLWELFDRGVLLSLSVEPEFNIGVKKFLIAEGDLEDKVVDHLSIRLRHGPQVRLATGTLVIYGDGRVNLYPVFKNINRNTN